MRKTHKIKTTDIEAAVMAKVSNNQIVMKPRWLFVLGSAVLVSGLVGAGLLSTFLINLAIFLLKQHGPNGVWRLQTIIESFPLWVPVLAAGGIIIGAWMLKKYDFAYKKNYLLITLALIVSIFLTAFLLDYSGLNNIWMKRGPMRQFNQQVQNDNNFIPRGNGQVKGLHKNSQINTFKDQSRR